MWQELNQYFGEITPSNELVIATISEKMNYFLYFHRDERNWLKGSAFF